MSSGKGVYLFLTLTFSLTIAASLIARVFGLSFFGAPRVSELALLVVAGAMFFPALSAILIHIFILGRPFHEVSWVCPATSARRREDRYDPNSGAIFKEPGLTLPKGTSFDVEDRSREVALHSLTLGVQALLRRSACTRFLDHALG